MTINAKDKEMEMRLLLVAAGIAVATHLILGIGSIVLMNMSSIRASFLFSLIVFLASFLVDGIAGALFIFLSHGKLPIKDEVVAYHAALSGLVSRLMISMLSILVFLLAAVKELPKVTFPIPPFSARDPTWRMLNRIEDISIIYLVGIIFFFFSPAIAYITGKVCIYFLWKPRSLLDT